MLPWTRSNNETTRKRQASNVDETAHKHPKTTDNEIGKDQQKKKKKKQPKRRAER